VNVQDVRPEKLVFQLQGKRYRVAAGEDSKFEGRAFQQRFASEQDVEVRPYTIRIASYHDGSGFTWADLPSVYDQADGWDCSAPGKASTVDRHGVGTATTTLSAAPRVRGWMIAALNSDGSPTLYLCRGRYVTKYNLNTTYGGTWTINGSTPVRDLGAGNEVAGRPIVWSGKVYVPVHAGSTGVLGNFLEITPVAGGDTYVSGPAARRARCFRTWKNLLIRADGNGVATCATTPTTDGNWSDAGVGLYQVGDPGVNITDLAVWDQYIVIGKEDGLWSLDENFYSRNEIPSLQGVRSRHNCLGMEEHNGEMFIPHQGGLIRWTPKSWRFVGPEQEGALDVTFTPWGVPQGVAPYGAQAFVFYKDEILQNAALVSLHPPRGARGPYIPHMHFKPETEYLEHGCVVTTVGAANETQSYLATIRTNTAGTVATPWIYRLPRAGLTFDNDSAVPHTVENRKLRTSRFYEPGRDIMKTYRAVEFDMIISGAGGVGLSVWASINEQAAIQLLDSAGAAASFTTSGWKRVFFPATAASTGRFLYLEFRIASGTARSFEVRDVSIRLGFRPTMGSQQIQVALNLTEGQVLEDRGNIRRTIDAQRADLQALLPSYGSAPLVSYVDPWGDAGYCSVEIMEFRETDWRPNTVPQKLAILGLRKERYDG
jgi:hypothetical protein